MLDILARVQKEAIEGYGRDNIRETTSISHVIMVTDMLSDLMDAERRHVTLSSLGLTEALTRVFVECLSLIRGHHISEVGIDTPMGIDDLCEFLREDIFRPRNEKYGNTFGNFGAVGVVIRLLDHAQALSTTGNLMSAVHMANYAAMALLLLDTKVRMPS